MGPSDAKNSSRMTYGLRDTLDVVTQDLAVALSTALAESLEIAPKDIKLCESELVSKVRTLPPFPRPDMFQKCNE